MVWQGAKTVIARSLTHFYIYWRVANASDVIMITFRGVTASFDLAIVPIHFVNHDLCLFNASFNVIWPEARLCFNFNGLCRDTIGSHLIICPQSKRELRT